MATPPSRPEFMKRVQDLTVRESGRFVELSMPGLSATFYKTHFESLHRHFADVANDFRAWRGGTPVSRTNQGYLMQLYEKTMKRIAASWDRGRINYTRWLAVATATWLKVYLQPGEPVETVTDYFFNLGDEELEAETTQRARQMIAWQAYCVKVFAPALSHPEPMPVAPVAAEPAAPVDAVAAS